MPFEINKIQEEINKFFLLSEKERKILGKEGREFILNDTSEEKIKNKTLKLLFRF